VLVRDAGGTPVANVPVTFAVASGGGSVEGGDAITAADGVATVGSWTLGETLGDNTLTATVQADDVQGNPVTFHATATPGAPSPNRSSVSATPGTIPASTGSAASAISVIVRDSHGNPLAGKSVSLSATGSGVSIAQPGPTDPSGATSGRFSATGAGEHVITAQTDGVTLGTTTVRVTAGPLVASSTEVTVPGGTAGSETAIEITLKDQFGNAVPGAAGQVAVAVSGANANPSLSVEESGGRYRARYTPTVVGTDQIDVSVGGQPAPGSPFSSVVVAGPPDPRGTTALVPDGSFGGPLDILVFLGDAQGNRVGRDAGTVAVTVRGVTALTVEYAGDGIYRARWTPFVVGVFQIDITLDGTPIANSPFSTTVRFF
jgi:adhesin/invasin